MAPTSEERQKADAKPVALYDESGDLVGMWSRETGRVMLGSDFYTKERGLYENAQRGLWECDRRGGDKRGGDDGK